MSEYKEDLVIPSNEEVLQVTEKGDEIDITDLGNEESAKVIESDPDEL